VRCRVGAALARAARRGVAASCAGRGYIRADGVPARPRDTSTATASSRCSSAARPGGARVLRRWHSGRIVTFKRGGSDFSAVALGVALRASWVELCKAEVDGSSTRIPTSIRRRSHFVRCRISSGRHRARRRQVLQPTPRARAEVEPAAAVRPAFKPRRDLVGQAVDGLVGERSGRLDA